MTRKPPQDLDLTWGGLAVVLLAVVSLSCGDGQQQGGLPAGPHPVIVVAIDGLRADHLGCYSYDRATSPNLDAFAAEAVRFEWAFTQSSVDAAAYASLLTGLYPTTHGLRNEGDVLVGDVTTLAEAFSAAGVSTAAFVDSGVLSGSFGLSQGFASIEKGSGVAEIGPKAVQWLEQHARDRSFLLLVHSSDLKPPWDADAASFTSGLEALSEGFAATPEGLEALRERLAEGEVGAANDLALAVASYDGEIRQLDSWFGTFTATLDELGLADRATVVVVGGFGYDLGTHEQILNQGLYASVSRVPMLIRFPRGERAGAIDRIVETIDLMPTLTAASGVASPPSLQGKSLLPIIENAGTPPYIAFAEAGAMRSVVLGGYHMLFDRDTESTQLFVLAEDPAEALDRSTSTDEQDRVTALRDYLDSWEKMVAAASYDPELRTEELDDATLAKLKSLGYVQ
jgi:arylsulfatase A-like enzyme